MASTIKEKTKKLSPMMTHRNIIKEQYPDCIVFYRLGDFYEMFFEDAVEASTILDLTLTGRDCGLDERAPMCGVPYHASQTYIAKLLNAGKKIAIVEQVGKGEGKTDLFKREVIRVVTPGTVTEENCLNEKENNFIASIFKNKNNIGVCWADISTGEMKVAEFIGAGSTKALDEILSQVRPVEIICNAEGAKLRSDLVTARGGFVPEFSAVNDNEFLLTDAVTKIKDQFNIKNLATFELQQLKFAVSSAGALLSYLGKTQMQTLKNLKRIEVYHNKNFMHLDINARRNLELTENMLTRKKAGSLLGLLDSTKTSMGARKIRQYIENPLLDEVLINDRLDAISELNSNLMLRETARELLVKITDIERLCGKMATNTITPKDCYSLGCTLEVIPKLKNAFCGTKSKLVSGLVADMFDTTELAQKLLSAFDEHAPVNFKDGDFILRGFDGKLDQLKQVSSMGLEWISKYEAKERERTGIKNLKINYNKVFGYCIEITKSNYGLVPDNYIPKQTMKDSQKYITPELKEAEVLVLSGNDTALNYELELYGKIKEMLGEYIAPLLKTASSIAELDTLISLSNACVKNNYVRPVISSDVKEINIVGGRHPVIESILPSGQFIDNDTLLDNGENNILIITGPNMGGKSTYMRQVAIITLMAHIGCFVPATRASIALTDRIFTRIGASDELALGNSTFMVEMMEVSNIINNATENSLLILDEVGRGTSTFDGMSLAWAIIEYISANIKAKTLFATHYHELIELEEKVVGVKNYRVLAKEYNNSIIFLHKIARGSANRSFGIEVAKLAGLPGALLDRSKQILRAQEQASNKMNVDGFEGVVAPEVNPNAIEVINVLKEMDLDTISPIMAFGTLQNLVDKVRNTK